MESVFPVAKFRPGGLNGKKRTSEEIKENYEKGDEFAGSNFCQIVGTERPGPLVKLSFGFYEPLDIEDAGISFNENVYGMPARSVAASDSAYLYFECASPRLDGSDEQAALIVGRLRYERKTAEGTLAQRDANMTILHAATLAVAKKLECENDGGLPAKADLRVLEASNSDKEQ
ncbi:hypothetical protein [Streptomyces sp. NPDC059092]|uniref:hypothetical protein n=1 Tax=Streptomyces sp. NPDC059092 TaxID=3346725 RepID=UPI0036CD97D7